MTETGYVSGYMEQLALSHQDISFKYMVNGQTKLHTSGNSNLKDVIYGIYGRDITRELVPVAFEKPGISIEGFIGKPVIARGNRNFENYYINGRYVKSKILMKAIEEAYKPYMMQHKYPFVCLHYDIEGEEIDVNVHPTKMEVRFQNQGAVYNATYDMITAALSHREMIPEVELEKRTEPKQEKTAPPEPFETGYKQQAKKWESSIKEAKTPYVAADLKPAIQKPSIPVPSVPQTGLQPAMAEPARKAATVKSELPGSVRPQTEVHTPTVSEKPSVSPEKPVQMELFDDRLLSKKARLHHRIIGQLFETYWLVEYDNKFYIIDQHAAHEKVLYERFMKEFANREIVTQMVSPPQVISLNLQEDLLLKTHMELFKRFGFEISEFGGREYSIHGVPANLYGISVQNFFVELLDSLENENARQPLDILTGRIATAACKAAVKGNNTLSVQEADKLIDELLGLDNPYHCPHGRPTIISMTKYELEKKFKRIV